MAELVLTLITTLLIAITSRAAARPQVGRESRSRTPGSRAMHSSNRARLVRTLQLANLKNGHDF